MKQINYFTSTVARWLKSAAIRQKTANKARFLRLSSLVTVSVIHSVFIMFLHTNSLNLIFSVTLTYVGLLGDILIGWEDSFHFHLLYCRSEATLSLAEKTVKLLQTNFICLFLIFVACRQTLCSLTILTFGQWQNNRICSFASFKCMFFCHESN